MDTAAAVGQDGGVELVTDTVSVLVIDDNNSAATYDLWFQEDGSRRRELGLRPEMFVRYGDVQRTPQAGGAALLASFNDGLPPDLVVIDHLLSIGGIDGGRQTAGLEIMRWMRQECARRGVDPPKAVLWTARYEPGLAYAFVQEGGRHAASRDLPVSEFLELLWRVHERDETWAHTWTAPKLELTQRQQDLLPYLEADLPTHEIAARMTADPALEYSITVAQVTDHRGAIKERINRLREDLGQPRMDGSGLSVSLAAYARLHGHIWVPLEYRE